MLWKALQDDNEGERIHGINTKLLIDAEIRRTEDMSHVDDEASDLCKARVRRRMREGDKNTEAPLVRKQRFELVETQRAG
jgi:hypothetical protein